MELRQIREILALKDGESCAHPYCTHHVLIPCIGCGRYEAKGELWLSAIAFPTWLDEQQNKPF